MAQNKNCSQIFDIMLTFHDIVATSQLTINYDLTVCIFESRRDIENLMPRSYSVPLKTPKKKFEGIPLNDVEGDTF